MKRREFIVLLAGAAAGTPLRSSGVHAQQAGKVPRIGFLGANLKAAPPKEYYEAFLGRLRDLGFNEGQNFVVEHRPTDDPRGIFVVAAELMRLQPDLIVATGPEASLQAVVGASRAVPVVMMATNFDPIARGYVTSLARPGGNITGVVYRQLELAEKQVEILNQTFPERKRLAILFDALSADQFGAAERSAKALKIESLALKLENPPYDFAAAIRRATSDKAQMVLVLSTPHFIPQRTRIAELAVEHRLPTMFINRAYVEAGGLMSYGVDFAVMYRRIADYVARILTGEKPANLPIEQATTFQAAVNLKTAKAIGVELPTAILLRADKVIE
jgi:putative ABC transport system substrate-binding protein